ncbi:hypothetical protein LINGRAHAP2_LOCUS15677, partial [Linum grandiflorum]
SLVFNNDFSSNTANPQRSALPWNKQQVDRIGHHGSSARAGQLHLRRLWNREYSQARRCHPVPRVRLPYSLQEAYPSNCPVRGTLEIGCNQGNLRLLSSLQRPKLHCTQHN